MKRLEKSFLFSSFVVISFRFILLHCAYGGGCHSRGERNRQQKKSVSFNVDVAKADSSHQKVFAETNLKRIKIR